MRIALWVARLLAAGIMLQTLYFKFSGAPESIEIFTRVGMEPWGRYGVGVMELIASVLLVVPAVSWLGALLGAGLMAGAIFMHLTILGIEVRGDNGQLFWYAVVVTVCCAFVLVRSKDQLLEAASKLLGGQVRQK